MYPRSDEVERLYGMMVCPGQLAHMCDQLEALPPLLLTAVLAGLYRSAPNTTLQPLGRRHVRAAFTDHAERGRRPPRLRCNWRVRRILEEYGWSASLFYLYQAATTTWLSADRFVQSRGGEFWSLSYCLTVVGRDPGRSPPER